MQLIIRLTEWCDFLCTVLLKITQQLGSVHDSVGGSLKRSHWLYFVSSSHAIIAVS